eukprot:CAMPEP_0175943018 /NCGR_PEP_ID=MMETSP0108-20121206/25299_1 /TAXON_ID=195067 ORGANISM="Goniomonas pacifica, Strain CCMP1869" /NCGR_SAMPLE_ID=MMETSP0108 /ASSEMBLY_ACC=CAM_ASM_000204 /LENGTH=100 /DNA_ID=CAMNT_0017267895 /DNA_START=55 /DNA_END=357 /DNA_ORIENTATION=-
MRRKAAAPLHVSLHILSLCGNETLRQPPSVFEGGQLDPMVEAVGYADDEREAEEDVEVQWHAPNKPLWQRRDQQTHGKVHRRVEEIHAVTDLADPCQRQA